MSRSISQLHSRFYPEWRSNTQMIPFRFLILELAMILESPQETKDQLGESRFSAMIHSLWNLIDIWILSIAQSQVFQGLTKIYVDSISGLFYRQLCHYLIVKTYCKNGIAGDTYLSVFDSSIKTYKYIWIGLWRVICLLLIGFSIHMSIKHHFI